VSGRRQLDLAALGDAELLRLRLCDLPLQIRGTWLEECVQALYRELDGHGITFHPSCYLADEWLTPDNEPVIGIPFFLAHPRLQQLERHLMHEAEGGTPGDCMKLLRHEAGHALNYAFQLYTRRKWRQLFGRFSQEYPDRYKYRPYSRNFVIHLDNWYAQYHPDEDFAETFAVWLTPREEWREKYRRWKALKKLEYVDELMREIAGTRPVKKTGEKWWNISRLKTTLKTYYRRKQEFYAEEAPGFHDAHLEALFTRERRENVFAAERFLSLYRRDIVDAVARWSGERKYVINCLLASLMRRSRELKLYASTTEPLMALRTSAYVTALIMNYVHTGRFKGETREP
jgi:hypothetical protein